MAFGKKGTTDMPALIDQFEIEKYINGLTKFISECNTPMTLAIQGDWGTGKTSVMAMVQDKILKSGLENIETVWFNTWQFSQFNLDEQLPILMMSKLISSVSNGKGYAVENLKKFLVGVAGVVAGYASGGASNRSDIQDILSSDFVDQIDNLKNTFQNLVREKAGENGRVVVFIDDLDRLQPGKAVELLEVLKVFLDCEQCVFVLAIDYGVVCRGVKEKYGEDFNDEKGKSFFDKIIQVPFKMPVANYNTINYIREGFKDIGMNVNEDSLQIYESLIRSSIGNNPRGMKRLFNSFLLLEYVADESIFKDSQKTEILFALLCMQSRYEIVYNFLIENRENIDAKLVNSLLGQDDDFMNQFKLSKADSEDFRRFIEYFECTIDRNQDGERSIDEINDFKYVLSFSAITANNARETIDNSGEYRWRHKDRCRRIRDRLNQKYSEKGIVFSDWHNIKDKGTWWVYFRSEKEGANPKFGYEFRLDPLIAPNPSGNKMTSRMTIAFYTTDKKAYSLETIIEAIGNNPLSELGYTSVVESKNRIWYKDIFTFNTMDETADEEIFEIAVKSFDAIMQYINI